MKKVNRRQQLHANYPACKELIIKRVVAHGPFHCSFGVRKLIRMKRIKKLLSRALVPWISISISRSINCYQCHQPYKGCHWEPAIFIMYIGSTIIPQQLFISLRALLDKGCHWGPPAHQLSYSVSRQVQYLTLVQLNRLILHSNAHLISSLSLITIEFEFIMLNGKHRF